MKFLINLLFIFSLNANSFCESAFVSKFPHSLNTSSIEEISQALKASLKGRNETIVLKSIEKELKRNSDFNHLKLLQDGKLESEVVVLGGGIHGSITANGLKQANAKRSVLVVDKLDCLGVFNCLGDTFFINSPEFLKARSSELYKLSKNHMTGMPIQPSDFSNLKIKSMEVGDSEFFIPGKYIGNSSNMNMASSGADLLMGEKIMSVKRINGSRFKYELKLSGGKSIFTNKIIMPSGLGTPSIPLKDLTSLEVAKKHLGQKINHIESYMRKMQLKIQEGTNILKVIKGKKIAVVGGGDGGAIITELLLGKGPSKAYIGGITKSDLPKQIVWFGQKKLNSTQYIENTWERYRDLSVHFPGGKEKQLINPIDGYLEKIKELPNGKFKVSHENGTEIVDEIVFSAGYKDESKTIFKEFLKGSGEFSTSAKTLDSGEVVARKLTNEEVYFVGPQGQNIVPGGGGLATTALDPGGVNSPRIEVLAPKTFSFAITLD